MQGIRVAAPDKAIDHGWRIADWQPSVPADGAGIADEDA